MPVFVVSNCNVVIPRPDGGPPLRLTRGYMGPVSDWAVQTAYFKALVADGKVILSPKAQESRRAAAGKPQKAAKRAGSGKEAPDVSGG